MLREQLASPIVARRYRVPFALIAALFFAWALAAGLNDVLIRQFQKALDLTRTQASFIQMTFYIGYFCAAIPAAMVIRRMGYKATMLCGLALYAIGALMFYPAAEVQRYGMFLVALYVIAFGLAFLETSANPYVTILGDPRTASARLNLAQAFNGLGAVAGPVVGGLFILSEVDHSPEQLQAMTPVAIAAWRRQEALAVQGAYLGVAAVVAVIAAAIAVTRFPPVGEAGGAAARSRSIFAVLRRPTLVWAVVAQFFYVGAQVGIWSFFIDFARTLTPWLSERTLAFLLSGSLAMLMAGRFIGVFLQRFVAPARLLATYAFANVALCLVATLASGVVAVAALWLTSFFMSIMFPTIFALGVAGLRDETENGSSFLIMAIIGGALVPPAMGLLSDTLGGVHHMMVVPAACFAIVAVYALGVGGKIVLEVRR